MRNVEPSSQEIQNPATHDRKRKMNLSMGGLFGRSGDEQHDEINKDINQNKRTRNTSSCHYNQEYPNNPTRAEAKHPFFSFTDLGAENETETDTESDTKPDREDTEYDIGLGIDQSCKYFLQ